MSGDRKSWDVKNDDLLGELVTLMNVSAAEASLLGALRDEAARKKPEFIQRFYSILLEHDHTREYFDGVNVPAVQEAISTWFADLFGGTYDSAYADTRLRIGETHVRIGLPIRYPLAMLSVVMEVGDEITATAANPAAAACAFNKVLALDVAIFNQAYENNQLSHLTDLVGSERLARRLLMGGS